MCKFEFLSILKVTKVGIKINSHNILSASWAEMSTSTLQVMAVQYTLLTKDNQLKDLITKYKTVKSSALHIGLCICQSSWGLVLARRPGVWALKDPDSHLPCELFPKAHLSSGASPTSHHFTKEQTSSLLEPNHVTFSQGRKISHQIKGTIKHMKYCQRGKKDHQQEILKAWVPYFIQGTDL